MKGKIKAILLDLDGTIIDTAPEMVQILYEMLKLYKHPLPSYKLARSMFQKLHSRSMKRMIISYLTRSTILWKQHTKPILTIIQL